MTQKDILDSTLNVNLIIYLLSSPLYLSQVNIHQSPHIWSNNDDEGEE